MKADQAREDEKVRSNITNHVVALQQQNTVQVTNFRCNIIFNGTYIVNVHSTLYKVSQNIETSIKVVKWKNIHRDVQK